jgi:hypothetical protein
VAGEGAAHAAQGERGTEEGTGGPGGDRAEQHHANDQQQRADARPGQRGVTAARHDQGDAGARGHDAGDRPPPRRRRAVDLDVAQGRQGRDPGGPPGREQGARNGHDQADDQRDHQVAPRQPQAVGRQAEADGVEDREQRRRDEQPRTDAEGRAGEPDDRRLRQRRRQHLAA